MPVLLCSTRKPNNGRLTLHAAKVQPKYVTAGGIDTQLAALTTTGRRSFFFSPVSRSVETSDQLFVILGRTQFFDHLFHFLSLALVREHDGVIGLN